MTKKEIIENGNFRLDKNNPDYSEFSINLYLHFFGKKLEILFANLPSLHAEPKMTVITEIINELLTYDKRNKEWLKDEIWKHYNSCIENTSYGMVPQEGFENEADANRAYFKIHNREAAYRAAELDEIWVDIDFTDFRYFNLSFHCPWDEEHGINIGVKNGNFDSIY